MRFNDLLPIRSSAAHVTLAALLTAMLPAGSVSAAPEPAKKIYSAQELATMPAPGPNPYLAYLPAGTEVDWSYWNQKMKYEAELRAERQADARALQKRGAVSETESNDTLGTAQAIPGFGTGLGEDAAVTVSGTFPAFPASTAFTPATEDEGAIGSASPTGLTSGQVKTASGTIGDGPHGSAGTGTADFDFFSISGATAGAWVTMAVTTASPTGDLDPNCAAWDSSGTLVAFNEDISGANYDCTLRVQVPGDGAVYLSIGGWKLSAQGSVLPADPFDASSGTGAASEGTYDVEISLGVLDVDCFAVALEPGDILGTGSTGTLALTSVYNTAGELQMGSGGSGSGIYPAASQLPSAGVTTDFVAYQTGDHYVCVLGDEGAYTLQIEAYRSVFEGTLNQQILFVDFDGATVNPSIWGGPAGSANLSPLSSFLAGWGLAPTDEDAVIDAILASLNETITQDLAALSNADFGVEIRNSRDHADPFGQPNVSRLIVGGTIAQLGISTIGIAESIDPGNFETEESAVILLDLLSAAASNPNSLNQFGIDASTTKIAFIGTALGNITAHEAGHYLGNWHTEQFAASSDPSIMDQGGNLAGTTGVGADEIFGTGDDFDVDFSADAFVASEGFEGTEHTGEKTAHALTYDISLFADGFESGNTSLWSSAVP